jgi:sugar phosphate isomerase/epimerase
VTRRDFLQTSPLVAAFALQAREAFGAVQSLGVSWPIGCFNRPWVKWGYDESLDGIKAAGYRVTGLLTVQPGEPFTSAAATPEYLTALKRRITSRGLTANMTAIRLSLNAPVDDVIKDLRAQIDNASRMELPFMLTFGVDRPEDYDKYYRVMADGAAYADRRGIKLVLKPHGGGSGASEEILRCMEKVAHPNFNVWYDAGNIIYYTGKDPLAELEPVVKYVTGFCAKDCPAPRGEVMSQFGTGKVDFRAVFSRLKAAGFNGPIMVEGVTVGGTPAETTDNARANRIFLERLLR